MNNQRTPPLWILALMVSFPAVLAILFTPALPDLAHFFQISLHATDSSMTTYLLGYALGMLIYGPIASRFGRKLTLQGGFALALIATLLSLWAGIAKIFWLFCIMRFVQGFGASSGMKISMTMTADTHSGEKETRMVSYLIFFATMVPAIGLGIGGSLASHYGWEGCFIFMAIYCALLLILTIRLPETATDLKKDALVIKHMIRQYTLQFGDSFLVLHALITGLCTSIYYFYITQGPYLGINLMGLTPNAYGWLALIPVCGMGAGCLAAARFAGRLSARRTLITGFLCAFAGLIIVLACFSAGWVTLASFFLPMTVVQIGVYIMSPTSLSIALDKANDKSNASAVSQFINFGMSFCAVLILSLIRSDNPLIMPILIGLALIAILAIWLKLKTQHDRLIKT